MNMDEKLLWELRNEMSNQLAAIQLLTELVREQGGAAERKSLAVLEWSFHRMMRLIGHLELCGEEEPVFQPVKLDLAGLCHELCMEIQSATAPLKTAFQYDLTDGNLLVLADESLLRAAVLDLVSNAIQAAGPEGRVELRLTRREERAMITVADNGPGQRGRAEDPYPSLRQEAGGLGLGVAAARRAVGLHGGALMLEEGEEGGVRAVISLPLCREKGEQVKTGRIGYDRSGGFSPVLVGLSPVLPVESYDLLGPQ